MNLTLLSTNTHMDCVADPPICPLELSASLIIRKNHSKSAAKDFGIQFQKKSKTVKHLLHSNEILRSFYWNLMTLRMTQFLPSKNLSSFFPSLLTEYYNTLFNSCYVHLYLQTINTKISESLQQNLTMLLT